MTKIEISTLDLLKSLTIKVDVVGDFLNRQISTYGRQEIDPDRKTWMYYMNMAGIKHSANSDIKMFSLDTKEEIILSREVLKEHPRTKNELLKYGEVFRYVSEDNSNQETYLRGILTDLTLDEVVNAPDNSVIYYDKSLVSYREDNLILDINEAIQSFLSRWLYPSLTFDDRYVATILAQLYSVVILAINNSRLKALNTEKASDNDIEEFFKSTLMVDDIIPYISDNVKIWLYANLKRLRKESGLDKTLREIYTNVLKPCGIAGYSLNAVQTNVRFNTSAYNLQESPWFREIVLGKYPLDNENVFSGSLPTEEYLELTSNLTGIPQNIKDRNKAESLTKIDYLKNTSKTKSLILELNKVEHKIPSQVTLKIQLENWILMGLSGRDKRVLTVRTATDGNFTLTSREAVLFALKLIIGKEDIVISKLETSNVINNTSLENLHLLPTTRDVEPKRLIENLIPERPEEFYGDEFLTYCSLVSELKETLMIYKQNLDEVSNFENLQRIEDYIFESKTITVNPTGEPITIDDVLYSIGVKKELINAEDVLKQILSTFINVNGYGNNNSKEILTIFKNFLSKFLSYNIHVLTPNDQFQIAEQGRGLNVNRGYDIFKILKLKIRPLDEMCGNYYFTFLKPTDMKIIIDNFNSEEWKFSNLGEMELVRNEIKLRIENHAIFNPLTLTKPILPSAKFKQSVTDNVQIVNDKQKVEDLYEDLNSDINSDTVEVLKKSHGLSRILGGKNVIRNEVDGRIGSYTDHVDAVLDGTSEYIEDKIISDDALKTLDGVGVNEAGVIKGTETVSMFFNNNIIPFKDTTYRTYTPNNTPVYITVTSHDEVLISTTNHLIGNSYFEDVPVFKLEIDTTQDEVIVTQLETNLFIKSAENKYNVALDEDSIFSVTNANTISNLNQINMEINQQPFIEQIPLYPDVKLSGTKIIETVSKINDLDTFVNNSTYNKTEGVETIDEVNIIFTTGTIIGNQIDTNGYEPKLSLKTLNTSLLRSNNITHNSVNNFGEIPKSIIDIDEVLMDVRTTEIISTLIQEPESRVGTDGDIVSDDLQLYNDISHDRIVYDSSPALYSMDLDVVQVIEKVRMEQTETVE